MVKKVLTVYLKIIQYKCVTFIKRELHILIEIRDFFVYNVIVLVKEKLDEW